MSISQTKSSNSFLSYSKSKALTVAYQALFNLAWGYLTSFLTILSNRLIPTMIYHSSNMLRPFPFQGLCSCCSLYPPHHICRDYFSVHSGLYKCHFLKDAFLSLTLKHFCSDNLNTTHSVTTLYPLVATCNYNFVVCLSHQNAKTMKAGTLA